MSTRIRGEAKRASDPAWYAANRERKAATRAAWAEKNKARTAETDRAWRLANIEKRKAYNRAWASDNRPKARVYVLNSRARAAGVAGVLTVGDVERALQLSGGRCACCSRDDDLSVDHVVALARGGSNTRDNIQILCRSCNSAKQDRDNSEFFLSRQLVGVESAPAAPPAS